MREIKFRAWDKKNKIMIDPEMLEGLFGNMKSDDGQTILMQYTGLKDKNGVEIYEDDVVKYKFTNTLIIPVTWHQWEEEMSTGVGFYFPWFFEKDDIEVLGNIYQNPELLKK